MTKRQTGVLTALSLAVFFLAMMTAQRFSFRLDLTRDKAFTLSRPSKELYKDIPERVVITYYLSEALAAVNPMPAEIIDFLREYAAASNGRIAVEIRDPGKTGTVAAIERLGIEGQQIQKVANNEPSVETVYTGIVIEYLDRIETLPVVFSLDTLEYDLTSRIRSLVGDSPRTIGLMVADSDKKIGTDFPFLERSLSEAGYLVREVLPGMEIPGGLSALFVFGGAVSLDDWVAYQIDRYVRAGGSVLFAVEGVTVDRQADLRALPVGPSPLLDLLAAYGVRVERQLALDKAALTLPYQSRSPTGGTQSRLILYPEWIALLARDADRTHPVTARFTGLDLYWASPLDAKAPSGVEARVLATTTEDGWRMTRNFRTNPEDVDLFYAEAFGTTGRVPLVVALSGTFPSPYLGRPKPTRAGTAEVLRDLSPTASPARVLVVGDSDFATTLIQYSAGERNLDFLVSAADWLGGEEDLIPIRSKAARIGRLDAISDPDSRSRAAFFSQTLNVFIVPPALIVFAFLSFRKRRRDAHGL